MLLRVPFYKQKKDHLCGPAALQMIFAHFGKRVSQERLAREMKTTVRWGTMRSALVRAARRAGFRVRAQHRGTAAEIRLFLHAGVPVVVNYIEPADEEGHYAVAVGYERGKLILNDPWNGKGFRIAEKEFVKRWRGVTPAGARYGRWMMAILPPERDL